MDRSESMVRPNVLFIFSDQHRWCDLGCYGNQDVATPHFDAFAEKAAVFTNCISNSPLCVPSRGTLLTGVYPLRHGAVTNDLPIKTDVTSTAHVFAEHGYQTGYIGKWHLAGVPRQAPIPAGDSRLGYKEWKVCNCAHSYLKFYYENEDNERFWHEGYEPELQTDLSIDFIQRNRDQPWFLTLSWGTPHFPYFEQPASNLDRYSDKSLLLRENVEETRNTTFAMPHLPQDEILTKEEIRQTYGAYYGHITALDEQFGRLIQTLKATGQLDNTIVVYTSDHGDMVGSHGFFDKQLPYDESIKVPLLVYWKDKTVVKHSDELIGLVDLPASLLGLAGLHFPTNVDGCDLHRLFVDKAATGLEACYIFEHMSCHIAEQQGIRPWRGVRTKAYTFARHIDDDGYMLFDNIRDPFQRDNLIDKPEMAHERQRLLTLANDYIDRHDRLLPPNVFIVAAGLRDKWNESQSYFGLPLLDA